MFAVTSWSNNPRRLTFRITEEVKRSSMNFISTVGKQNACPLECIVKQHCSQAVYIRALPNPTIYHSQLIEYQITVSDATTQTITPLGINLAPVTYFHSFNTCKISFLNILRTITRFLDLRTSQNDLVRFRILFYRFSLFKAQ